MDDLPITSPYDFKNPEYITQKEAAVIQDIFQDFANRTVTAMVRRAKIFWGLHVSSVRYCNYEYYFAPNYPHILWLELEAPPPGKERFYLKTPAPMNHQLLDLLLGGPGTVHLRAFPRPDSVELILLKEIYAEWMRALGEALKPLLPDRPQIQSLGYEMPSPKEERSLEVDLELNLNGEYYTINFCLPGSFLERIRFGLDPAYLSSNPRNLPEPPAEAPPLQVQRFVEFDILNENRNILDLQAGTRLRLDATLPPNTYHRFSELE